MPMSFAALFSLQLRDPCPRGRRERLTAGVAIRKKYRHHQRRRRDLPSFLTLARMDTDGNCSPAAPRCAWTGQYGSSEVANAGAEAWDRRYYANLQDKLKQRGSSEEPKCSASDAVTEI